MGKIKTHKASAKRFSVTGSGKVKCNHSQHRHNLGLKTQKRSADGDAGGHERHARGLRSEVQRRQRLLRGARF